MLTIWFHTQKYLIKIASMLNGYGNEAKTVAIFPVSRGMRQHHRRRAVDPRRSTRPDPADPGAGDGSWHSAVHPHGPGSDADGCRAATSARRCAPAQRF